MKFFKKLLLACIMITMCASHTISSYPRQEHRAVEYDQNRIKRIVQRLKEHDLGIRLGASGIAAVVLYLLSKPDNKNKKKHMVHPALLALAGVGAFGIIWWEYIKDLYKYLDEIDTNSDTYTTHTYETPDYHQPTVPLHESYIIATPHEDTITIEADPIINVVHEIYETIQADNVQPHIVEEYEKPQAMPTNYEAEVIDNSVQYEEAVEEEAVPSYNQDTSHDAEYAAGALFEELEAQYQPVQELVYDAAAQGAIEAILPAQKPAYDATVQGAQAGAMSDLLETAEAVEENYEAGAAGDAESYHESPDAFSADTMQSGAGS